MIYIVDFLRVDCDTFMRTFLAWPIWDQSVARATNDHELVKKLMQMCQEEGHA